MRRLAGWPLFLILLIGCYFLTLSVDALKKEECCDGDEEEGRTETRPKRNHNATAPARMGSQRKREEPMEEEEPSPRYPPRPPSKKPKPRPHRPPPPAKKYPARAEPKPEEDDEPYERAPPRRAPKPSRPRYSNATKRANSRRHAMTPDPISHRESQSIRRASALTDDIREGLAENYRSPEERNNNRSLNHGGRRDFFLNEMDHSAPYMGQIPHMELGVLDPPRSGYPIFKALSVQEGPDPLPKKISSQELSASVTIATELSGRDFAAIIMRHREPVCILGDYGVGDRVNPFTWATARPIAEAQYGYQNEFAAIRLANGLVKGRGDQLFSTLRKATDTGYQSSEDCYVNVKERFRCSSKTPYRTFDGSCNNLKYPDWGAAYTGDIHVTFAAYEDGISTPREISVVSLLNEEKTLLPSARVISVQMGRGEHRPDKKITMLVSQLGQFIAHDLMNTPVDLVENPAKKGDWQLPACCHVNTDPHCLHPSCFPIIIPPNDPFYGPYRINCMEFVRSQPANPTSCELAPRAPVNINSHWLDASTIYGSTLPHSMKLRGPRGTLAVNEFAAAAAGPLKYVMPMAGPDTMSCHNAGPGRPCMQSGDSRVNQHTGVISMSSLYIREHNRIAMYLGQIPELGHMPDEVIFQISRRILIAQHQHIVYNELLPILVGQRIYNAMSNGIALKEHDFCTDCYYDTVKANIAVEFGAAAFRLHTIVPNYLPARNSSGMFPPLFQHMLNPEMFYRPGIVDEILQGLVQQPAESFDPILSSQMQNHLFQQRNRPYGQDQHSLNLQRGRDQGVASYAEVRKACGLRPVTCFQDLEDVMSPRAVKHLATVYRHVLDIDFYAGGLAEYPVNGGEGLVGPTFACIITDQFARLRHGDRFWYENKQAKFTAGQLREIRKTTLAAMMCGNSPIERIQPRALLQDSSRNPVLPCDIIMNSALDLRPFLEDINMEKFPRFPAELSNDLENNNRRNGPNGRGRGPGGRPGGPGFPGGPGPLRGPGGPGGPGFPGGPGPWNGTGGPGPWDDGPGGPGGPGPWDDGPGGPGGPGPWDDGPGGPGGPGPFDGGPGGPGGPIGFGGPGGPGGFAGPGGPGDFGGPGFGGPGGPGGPGPLGFAFDGPGGPMGLGGPGPGVGEGIGGDLGAAVPPVGGAGVVGGNTAALSSQGTVRKGNPRIRTNQATRTSTGTAAATTGTGVNLQTASTSNAGTTKVTVNAGAAGQTGTAVHMTATGSGTSVDVTPTAGGGAKVAVASSTPAKGPTEFQGAVF